MSRPSRGGKSKSHLRPFDGSLLGTSTKKELFARPKKREPKWVDSRMAHGEVGRPKRRAGSGGSHQSQKSSPKNLSRWPVVLLYVHRLVTFAITLFVIPGEWIEHGMDLASDPQPTTDVRSLLQ
jgi:hypothetical protein